MDGGRSLDRKCSAATLALVSNFPIVLCPSIENPSIFPNHPRSTRPESLPRIAEDTTTTQDRRRRARSLGPALPSWSWLDLPLMISCFVQYNTRAPFQNWDTPDQGCAGISKVTGTWRVVMAVSGSKNASLPTTSTSSLRPASARHPAYEWRYELAHRELESPEPVRVAGHAMFELLLGFSHSSQVRIPELCILDVPIICMRHSSPSQASDCQHRGGETLVASQAKFTPRPVHCMLIHLGHTPDTSAKYYEAQSNSLYAASDTQTMSEGKEQHFTP
ncbi:hypothetical protein N658DRAFT_322730 [Parathielavia hyrcaniae]|uniref:Uncharacterized protein n=1 Tax=Parathielavia hyrcaniae TaxID=113614 RepID=A0AAN6Q8A4_9PEZI|nr:hypothetical protein N658DRAFT_322730 [Parathielavia hyrcaniae]